MNSKTILTLFISMMITVTTVLSGCAIAVKEFQPGDVVTVSKSGTDKYAIAVNSAQELNETQKLNVGLPYSEGKIISIDYDLTIFRDDEVSGWSQGSFQVMNQNGQSLEPAKTPNTLQLAIQGTKSNKLYYSVGSDDETVTVKLYAGDKKDTNRDSGKVVLNIDPASEDNGTYTNHSIGAFSFILPSNYTYTESEELHIYASGSGTAVVVDQGDTSEQSDFTSFVEELFDSQINESIKAYSTIQTNTINNIEWYNQTLRNDQTRTNYLLYCAEKDTDYYFVVIASGINPSTPEWSEVIRIFNSFLLIE